MCGADLSVDHAATYPTGGGGGGEGGYPTLRHNALHDLIAQAMDAAIPDVQIEPPLLPLEGEALPG